MPSVLVANVGSTSLKFKVFHLPQTAHLAEGRIENIGKPEATFSYKNHRGDALSSDDPIPDYTTAISRAMAALTDAQTGVLEDPASLDAIGFKTVHAKGITGAQELTDEVLQAMEDYNLVAPLHNPLYLTAIRYFKEALPQTPMYGLFETTFHRSRPLHERLYAVPREWEEKYGVRRFGFHGASHWYISQRAPELMKTPPGRTKIVSCHLGGSSSITGIVNGESVTSTMGFSPQSGLPQSARCGELDAFAVLYLIESGAMSAPEIRRVLCDDSGLLGLSRGLSGDVPILEGAEAEGNADARLALDAFACEVQKSIGACFAVMGGADAVVFTGGIGERGVSMRERVCRPLRALGMILDPGRNASVEGESRISTDASPVALWVIPTNEELIVAREISKQLT